ncbi:o-succinylbenzoate synthase [candidate division KSB1 bacterium]
MKIEKIELRLVEIPLKHYFETSFGRSTSEKHIIVKLFSEGLAGYGESAVMEDPSYCYETVKTAWHIQKDFLLPAIHNKNIDTVEDFIKSISSVRGNHFAKSGVEAAFWHLLSQKAEEPLFKLWEGTRDRIQSGVSIGIQENINELLSKIDGFLREGYKRIKIKIKPGWDVQVLKEIRNEFDTIPLMVDANAAYSISDINILQEIDKYELMMIEQPLHFMDLTDHAELQSKIKTPICLDESISGLRTAMTAIKMKSCKIINIKPGRVGGYYFAKKIHDLCQENDIPVWCGGMLEFGIGRAFNIALCSLPNFIYPGDVSSSSRYFQEDIVTPHIEFENGELSIPQKSGFGYKPDDKMIEKYTESKYELK